MNIFNLQQSLMYKNYIFGKYYGWINNINQRLACDV